MADQKTPTGLFSNPTEFDDQPSQPGISPIELATQLRFKGIEGQLETLEAKLDLLITLSKSSIFAKVCGHVVEVLRNENGQLKYLTGLAVLLTAIVYGVPIALNSQGVQVFAETPAPKEAPP